MVYIEDNNRIYTNLYYLHNQVHEGDNCFCTTEISGAYRNILNEINNRIEFEIAKALEGLEKETKLVKHL